MALLNKWSVGLGLGAASYGAGLLSMFESDQGSNPIVSRENKSLMLRNTLPGPTRTFGNEGDVSVAGFAGFGIAAGAILGGGLGLATRRFLPETLSEKSMFRSMANGVGRTGLTGTSTISTAAQGLMDFGPKNGATLLGLVSGGVVGAFAGGYAGASIFDRGVSRLTHNYLNSAGDSDVQGASEMKAPPTIAGAAAIAGIGLGVYGAHQFAGKKLLSHMANKNMALEKAGKAPIRPWMQTAATLGSSAGASALLAGATVMSVTQKMNSVNTNPNASKIEGLRY